MSKKYKTINSLMAHLRNKHHINIYGSTQKRYLQQYGYYHGFKGYRFVKMSNNRIPYSDFNELVRIIEMDRDLKSLFYTPVMFIETALKNMVLEIVLDNSNGITFEDVYYNVLDNYRAISNNSRKKEALSKRMNLRSNIYKSISERCKSQIVSHFGNDNRPIPIWAIFEVITLGVFAQFIGCMNTSTRQRISKELNIPKQFDTSALLPEKFIYIVKDFRNAIAHNATIFDSRFQNSKIDTSIIYSLENVTGVKGITFNSIVDYLILIIYLYKTLKVRKTDMKNLILKFKDILERTRKHLPINIYNQIIPTDANNKINSLMNYL